MVLVERLEGGRLERVYPGRTNGPVDEWRLRWDINEFREAIDAAPDMADQFLRFCLNDGPLHRVIFLTDEHFVYCTGPESMSAPGIHSVDRMLVELTIRTNEEGSREYNLLLDGPDDPAVLRCMLRVAALATAIIGVDVELFEPERETLPDIVPSMQDFVSMARSRRTVAPCFTVWPEMAQALAFHCSPLVALDVYLSCWHGVTSALAEAIHANQCPARLTLRSIDNRAADHLAPALEATTRIEDLTLHVQHYSCTPMFFGSIGRNGSIRALVVKDEGPLLCRDVVCLWNSILKSTTIQSVDASTLFHERSTFTFSPADRQACAGAVVTAIRSNPHITRILYDPRIHDARIMESRVVPVLLFNKFRPVVKALFEGSTDRVGRERAVSALLLSPLIRRHPELLYILVKANRENLLSASWGVVDGIRPDGSENRIAGNQKSSALLG
jgi:hypothetical protein